MVYVNGEQRRLPAAATLSEVLGGPGQPPPRGVAVALDGAVVPRAQLGETVLHEGARVEIVTAVQGG